VNGVLTLIDRFRMFARAASADDRIGSIEIAVYTMLLSIDNDLLFQEWFGCSDRRLQDMTNVGSVNTITKAKNRLKQLGWIDFKTAGKKTTLYKLTIPICETDTATVCETDTATVCETDTATLRRQDKTARQIDKAAADARAREEGNSLAEVVQAFENNIHPVTGKIEQDALVDLMDEYSALWVTEAIKEAALSNARNLRYITAILERWKREGFKAPRKGVKSSGTSRDNSREALEARYPDFVEADRNHVYPWEIQPTGGGDRAASG
jgi:DnaD/phage-associated family protein